MSTIKILTHDPAWDMKQPTGIAQRETYQETYAAQAEKLCVLLGATNKDLAAFFEVDRKVIERWREEHPHFGQAVARGKMIADAQVAESMFRQASGTCVVTKKKVFADPKTGKQTIVEYEETQPPNVVAGIFWLKNRQPAQWRDRPKIVLEDLETMTDEQLAEVASGHDPTA